MTTHPSSAAHAPYKQLRRPSTDRMIAGVASGIGRYFGIDPTLVRVIFAVAIVLTGGLAALAYPLMWFLMPEEPPTAPAWPGATPGGAPPAPAWPAPAPPATTGPTATASTGPTATASTAAAPNGPTAPQAPAMPVEGDRGPI